MSAFHGYLKGCGPPVAYGEAVPHVGHLVDVLDVVPVPSSELFDLVEESMLESGRRCIQV